MMLPRLSYANCAGRGEEGFLAEPQRWNKYATGRYQNMRKYRNAMKNTRADRSQGKKRLVRSVCFVLIGAALALGSVSAQRRIIDPKKEGGVEPYRPEPNTKDYARDVLGAARFSPTLGYPVSEAFSVIQRTNTAKGLKQDELIQRVVTDKEFREDLSLELSKLTLDTTRFTVDIPTWNNDNYVKYFKLYGAGPGKRFQSYYVKERVVAQLLFITLMTHERIGNVGLSFDRTSPLNSRLERSPIQLTFDQYLTLVEFFLVSMKRIEASQMDVQSSLANKSFLQSVASRIKTEFANKPQVTFKGRMDWESDTLGNDIVIVLEKSAEIVWNNFIASMFKEACLDFGTIRELPAMSDEGCKRWAKAVEHGLSTAAPRK